MSDPFHQVPQVLKGTQLREAVWILPSEGRSAAAHAAFRISRNPQILEDPEALRREVLQCCWQELMRLGVDPGKDETRLARLVDVYGETISTVAVSTYHKALVVARRKKWGLAKATVRVALILCGISVSG